MRSATARALPSKPSRARGHLKVVKDKAPPKRRPPLLITRAVERCQLRRYMNLFEVAYAIGKIVFGREFPKKALTVYQVSGALRSLGLMQDKTLCQTVSQGLVVRRQQTMVHKTQFKRIQDYLQNRLVPPQPAE